MHETMEHLRARATARPSYDVGGTTGTGNARNSGVPAPVHAPLGRRDTPLSRLRNALSIFAFADVAKPGQPPLFALDAKEQREVYELIVVAAAQLAEARPAIADL